MEQDEKVLVPRFQNRVSCSLFGINDDFIENYQSLDQRFIKNKTSSFLFEAEGDSMEPTIFKRDLLLVDRSIENFHSKVCILSFEGQLICKRVFNIEQGILLKSDNHVYRDIIISNGESIEVWGIVTSRHGEVL